MDYPISRKEMTEEILEIMERRLLSHSADQEWQKTWVPYIDNIRHRNGGDENVVMLLNAVQIMENESIKELKASMHEDYREDTRRAMRNATLFSATMIVFSLTGWKFDRVPILNIEIGDLNRVDLIISFLVVGTALLLTFLFRFIRDFSSMEADQKAILYKLSEPEKFKRLVWSTRLFRSTRNIEIIVAFMICITGSSMIAFDLAELHHPDLTIQTEDTLPFSVPD